MVETLQKTNKISQEYKNGYKEAINDLTEYLSFYEESATYKNPKILIKLLKEDKERMVNKWLDMGLEK